MDLNEELENEINNIKSSSISEFSDEQIYEIITMLKSIDKDLQPILDILYFSIKDMERKKATLVISKLLEFYGFNNKDILYTRQKFIIIDGKLVKKPFLKDYHKKCINILLGEYGVI